MTDGRHDPTRPERPGAGGEDLIGLEIDGYRVLSLLGEGGMGRVYKALDTQLGRHVAIKVVLAPLLRQEEFLARFEREARALSSINHPSIAQIYSAGDYRGVPYYAMEFIAGRSLAAILDQGRRLAGRRCLRYLIEAADGLRAASRQGLVHRDVKPSNLMIDAADHLKIVDFGLARKVDEDSSLTRAHGVLGTPRYMAPEQAVGGEVDHRSDIYSLGATFYHLFTGEPPFAATHPAGLAMQHVNTPLTPPRERNPRIPPAVDAIITRMMAKRPEDRYQDYADLIADLQQAAQGVTTPQPADRSAVAPAAGRTGQSLAPWALAVVGGLAILALGFGIFGRGGGGEPPAEAAPPVARPADPAPPAAEDRGRRRPAADRRGEPARPEAPRPGRRPAPTDLPVPPEYQAFVGQAFRAKGIANLRNLSTAIEVHIAETGDLPPDLQFLVEEYELHPQVLLDGWGREIRYQPLGGLHYRLASDGPDGRPDTGDDVVLEDGFVTEGGLEVPEWLVPEAARRP